jgi:hypothetical protein
VNVLCVSTTDGDPAATAGVAANGIREAGVVEFRGDSTPRREPGRESYRHRPKLPGGERRGCVLPRALPASGLRRMQRRGREFTSVFALGTVSASPKCASSCARVPLFREGRVCTIRVSLTILVKGVT